MSALLAGGWLLAVGAGLLLLAERRTARLRTERVVDACHELRAPITTVMLALDRPGGAGAGGVVSASLLPAISVELARARRAVEDLSAAMRPVAVDEERRPVDVAVLVRSLAAVHDVAARAAGRRVVAVAGGGTVVGDRARLAQAFGNLVQNALEHGDGVVRLAVTEAGGRVRVVVDDEGEGLGRPLADVIGAGRGQRGRGMRITRDVLVAHGGILRAAPSAGGARIVADLPAADVERATTAAVA